MNIYAVVSTTGQNQYQIRYYRAASSTEAIALADDEYHTGRHIISTYQVHDDGNIETEN